MKKQTKGIFFTALFGGGLLFWATAASLPGLMPPADDAMDEPEITITGTLMDNFPDEKRQQYCETGPAKSNAYITEYKIPTVCTQPLAITTDPQGNVWFAQTNAGRVGMFDPDTETFTEFENPQWPQGAQSMMWGIDYSPDGSIWFTDERFDSIWKFSIEDQIYQRLQYPSQGDSLPQRLQVVGSQIIVNDFTGNKISLIDPSNLVETTHRSIPSPINGSLTSGFGIDSQKNLWYTNWIFQQGGALIKFDQGGYEKATSSSGIESLPLGEFIELYQLPTDLFTPNGIAVGPDGRVWIADTSSSSFFSFTPDSGEFTKYVTSVPHPSAYGNATGLIKLPVSRPYWNGFTDDGNMVFTQQTSNRIGVFDPEDESLIEYMAPSQNSNWGDCITDDCGLAQIFDYAISGDKIWFTEWVENNIGVVDTSKPLPFEVHVDSKEISLQKGQEATINLTILPTTTSNVFITSSSTATFSDLTILPETKQTTISSQQTIPIVISASQSALATSHKVLVGVQTDEVVVSQYVTVTIEQ